MTRGEAVNWLINISADIGKAEHRELWHYEQALLEIREMLESEPERKKGEWIDCTEDGYVECPFCHSATNCDGNKHELHFCFSCGAEMRGDSK